MRLIPAQAFTERARNLVSAGCAKLFSSRSASVSSVEKGVKAGVLVRCARPALVSSVWSQ